MRTYTHIQYAHTLSLTGGHDQLARHLHQQLVQPHALAQPCPDQAQARAGFQISPRGCAVNRGPFRGQVCVCVRVNVFM